MNLVRTIGRELGEVSDSYKDLKGTLDKQGGTRWANALVSGAMAVPNYLAHHVTGEKIGYRGHPWSGVKIGGASSTPSPIKKKDLMPKPGKKAKNWVKKQVKKDVVQAVKGLPRRPRRPNMLGRVRRAGRAQRSFAGRVGTRPVQGVLNRGRKGTFGTAPMFYIPKRAGCLGMRLWVYVGDLGSYTDTSTPANTMAVIRHIDGKSMDQNIFLMPQNSYYFPSNVSTLVNMFERYKIKATVEFRNNAPTTQAGLFKFCYFSDPVAPYTNTGKSGVFPAASTFAANAYPPVWNISKAWEGSVFTKFRSGKSWIPPTEDLKYTGAQTYTIQMNAGSMNSEDIRASVQGLWTVTGSGFVPNSPGSFTALGECWLQVELELCDMLMGVNFQSASLLSCVECQGFKRPLVSHSQSVPVHITDRLSVLEDILRSSERKEKKSASRKSEKSDTSQRSRCYSEEE